MVKKIAVVCGALSIGGAENMICELLCNLNREKYEVKRTNKEDTHRPQDGCT